VTFADDAYSCAEGAHALVLVTEWEAFRALDLGRIRDLLVTPILVDLRNVYRADEVRRQGFSYTGVGRPADAEPGGRERLAGLEVVSYAKR
ncbi:MAG: UDP binding domain-containing protein, partial [Xanthobacteraceae bacterium]